MRINLTCCVCHNDNWIYLWKSYDRMLFLKDTFDVIKCNHCGLISYANRLTSVELKKHYPSTSYYSYISKFGGVLSKLRGYLVSRMYEPTLLSQFFTFFIKQVPAIPKYVKNGKVLDVGCGSGHTLLELERLGWRVYGVEIDKYAVKRANKNGLKHVYFGGYNRVSKFNNSFFDAIRIYHVIEHLENPEECMRILHNKLNNNGELLIGTPNIESITAKLFQSYWFNLDVPRHIWLFSPSTLTTLLTKSGFEIVSVTYCSGGGFVGSIQYIVSDLLNKKVNFVSKFYLFLIFYPIEWIFDFLRRGDVMIITAKKGSK